MRHEIVFNPLNHGEIWDQWDCCIFDRATAERTALALRDSLEEELRKSGIEVECFTLPNQRQHRSIPGWRIELEADVFGLRYESPL